MAKHNDAEMYVPVFVIYISIQEEGCTPTYTLWQLHWCYYCLDSNSQYGTVAKTSTTDDLVHQNGHGEKSAL